MLTSHLPELESGYFGAISKEGTSDEVRVKTAKAVHAAMKSLFPGCTAIQDFPFVGLAKSAEFKELEVYLLLTLLYQSLPQFLPKSSIDFHGALHDRVTRYVEINNPTGRAVLYSYSLMQRSDFCVDQFEIVNGSGSSTPGASVTTINMPPRSTIRVPILFNSRFNRNVSDQITFRSKKIGINNVSILVFLLNGVVEKSVPKKTFKVEAPMYCTPPSVVEMDITNPFNSKGKFKISLLSVKSTPYTAQELQLPPSSGEEDVKATDEEENKKREIRNPTPFYLSADELVIGACETENISLKFVPFSVSGESKRELF